VPDHLSLYWRVPGSTAWRDARTDPPPVGPVLEWLPRHRRSDDPESDWAYSVRASLGDDVNVDRAPARADGSPDVAVGP
jgi:hypothetical protein